MKKGRKNKVAMLPEDNFLKDFRDKYAKRSLESDPRFLDRIAQARQSIKAGRGIRLDDLKQ